MFIVRLKSCEESQFVGNFCVKYAYETPYLIYSSCDMCRLNMFYLLSADVYLYLLAGCVSNLSEVEKNMLSNK